MSISMLVHTDLMMNFSILLKPIKHIHMDNLLMWETIYTFYFLPKVNTNILNRIFI